MTTTHQPGAAEPDLSAEAERQDAAGRCPACGGEPDRCGCDLEEVSGDAAA